MAKKETDDVLYHLTKNHVLVGIVDEVLETSNLLQMEIGDYFLNSIFDPSVNQCIVQPQSLTVSTFA